MKRGAAAIVAESGYSLPEEDKKGADAVFVFVKDTCKTVCRGIIAVFRQSL
ncbi:MAG: hypothetical protein R2860_06970 [Desulfobacterales bacterium]